MSLYIAQVGFASYSEDGERDTEGHFTVVAASESADVFLGVVLPAKLRQIEDASELDYTEFYLTSLVELPRSFAYESSGGVVVGFVEAAMRPHAPEETWDAVALDADREIARPVDTSRISVSVPFAVAGKPPLRLRR